MELGESYDAIRGLDAELLAISVDTLDYAQQMQALVGARFPVLADPTHAVASAYGIFDLLGDGVAAPATFIISSGAIVAGHIGQDIGDRASAAAIIQTLRDLNSSDRTTAS